MSFHLAAARHVERVSRILTLAGAAATVIFAVVASLGAQAQEYRPGFACPRPDETDQLATAICADAGMAKAELILEKAYYLHREVEGPSAFIALKARAGTFDKTVRDACKIPSPGKPGPMPGTAGACYIGQATKFAKEWAGSLYGPPYDEAVRDIDTHIALQRQLISLGLLQGASADGVYGDATREAIISWQRARNLRATGFLSEMQARQLMGSSTLNGIISRDAAAERLQALFTRDMLEIRVAYLETLTGPAMRIAKLSGDREARTYRLAGCDVTAYVMRGDVYGYGLDVKRACKPDISDIFRSAPQTSWPMTFGTFGQDFWGAAYQANCLTSCGNSSVPLVLFRYQGPHASDYINVELTVALYLDSTLTASETWKDAMKPRGADYVINGKFNCEGRYQEVAQKAFAGIAFTHLFVGHGQDETADEVDMSCSR